MNSLTEKLASVNTMNLYLMKSLLCFMTTSKLFKCIFSLVSFGLVGFSLLHFGLVGCSDMHYQMKGNWTLLWLYPIIFRDKFGNFPNRHFLYTKMHDLGSPFWFPNLTNCMYGKHFDFLLQRAWLYCQSFVGLSKRKFPWFKFKNIW